MWYNNSQADILEGSTCWAREDKLTGDRGQGGIQGVYRPLMVAHSMFLIKARRNIN